MTENINIEEISTLNYTKGKLIINEFGNGFVNTEDKTIYINKKDLNKAFNYEIVEVEYKKDYQKNLYYGKIINYTLVGKILTGFVHHIYKNEIYIFVPELKKSNMVIIKTKTHLEKDMWVVIKITNDNNVNKKIEGELIEVLPDDVDSIVEKKYKLNQILVEEKDKKKENDMDNPNNEQQRFKHVYLDQKNLNTFTIDPFTSKDCDDAFSIDIIDNKTFPKNSQIEVHPYPLRNINDYFAPRVRNEFLAKFPFYSFPHCWNSFDLTFNQ